ncbi:MAG: putative nucleic acid-binding Zn-ribbon protein [Neolewinella sp.]|jgi:predicted  nucleic acid-binding Zn-ribbon protein
MEAPQMKPKSFWKKPEGITGLLFLAAIIGGVGFLAFALPWATILANTAYMVATIAALGVLIYMVLDPKMRNLVFYGYKSIMRVITGAFVQIDPIGILKTYVEELQNNLRKMNKQISQLRAQMHKLKELIVNNEREIKNNLQIAGKAKETNKRNVMILKSRRAGRLKDSNMRLEELYKKMEVLYRVLTKMYENSQILAEDIKDQVMVKEQERKAIHASHGAMTSAMSVINGDPDQRAMFDMAMDNITEDVANKVGEMERFMEMSANFMDSVDLQNGVFEEEGMQMLEQWEKESTSLLLGEEKDQLLLQAQSDSEVLDLDAPVPERARQSGGKNQYDSFFD